MRQPKVNNSPSAGKIASIEDSLREFWGNWGRAPQSELVDSPNLLRLYTGVPYAFCNGVICKQVPPDKIDAIIEETLSYYKARNVTWEWMVGSSSIPASLDQTLVKHGLSVHGESIGMAIDLHGMSQDIPTPGSLRIISIENDETLKIWATTMIEGFGAPALYPTFINLECSLGCQQPSYRRYLGMLDHQPVATSALYLGEKVAGVYCVSTVPKARRLGAGAAITHYALREAQAMGYSMAVLQSTAMGRNVYRKLGFEEFSILRSYCPAS